MRTALLAISLLVISPAWGDKRAGDLYAACISAEGTTGDALCMAYINGFVNGILADQVEREDGTPICIPDHANTAQIREVFKDFMGLHPQASTVDTGGALASIMAHVYPCSKSN